MPMRRKLKNIKSGVPFCPQIIAKRYSIAGAVLLLMLFRVTESSLAQNTSLVFNRLNVNDGLSQGSVLCISQDATGYIWLGTREGLNRYDGYRMQIFRGRAGDSTGLYSNYISSLLPGSEGKMWVGTTSGLHVYYPKSGSIARILLPVLSDRQSPMPEIGALFKDRKGTLWVGATSGLMRLTDSATMRFEMLANAGGKEPFISNRVFSICEDDGGQLWIGTSKGLVKLGNNRLPNQAQWFTVGEGSGLAVRSIAYDSAIKRLWIGTAGGGLYYLPDGGTRPIPYATVQNRLLLHNNVRTLLLWGNGQLYVGTQEGINLLQIDSSRSTGFQNEPENRQSLSQNSIYALYKDKSGSLWIGTYFGGANIVYASNTPFKTVGFGKQGSGLSNNVVSSIAEDRDGNLWIGTEGGGVTQWNRKNGNFRWHKNFPGVPGSLTGNLVKTLLVDKQNRVWAGLSGADICVVDAERQTWKSVQIPPGNNYLSPPFETRLIKQDSRGYIWISTNLQELWLYNPDSNKWTDTLPGTTFTTNKKPRLYNCWLQDSRGAIWLGTSDGLLCWKGAPHNLQTAEEAFGIKYSFARQVIHCLLEDNRGNIWMGTDSVMACLQPATGKLLDAIEIPGITGLHFYSLQEDKNGDIWAGTQAGLLRFDPLQKHTTLYNIYDGLPDNEFNLRAVATDSKGDLFFGTYNGLLHFATNDIARFQVNAPLAITGIRVFDKPLPASDLPLPANGRVTLKHNQDVLTIEFALLNFIKPYKTRYAWKLSGVDKTWQYGSEPQVTYSQLNPGTYVFEVKAANHDGYWLDEPVRLTIKIMPPLWRTWWALLIYSLLAAAGIVFVTRFFWLRAKFRRREAMQQFKLDFFTNISHEIRTHLTLIAAPVEQIMLERSHDAPLLYRLNPIKNNADKLQTLVGEMMDLNQTETGNLKLKIEKHNLAAFLQEIINAVQVSADSKQVNLLLDCAYLHLYLYFDAIQMEKVFFNLLTNALKFTQPGGTIKVSAKQEDAWVHIMVEDNGRGMDEITLKKIFTAYYQGEQHSAKNAGYGLGLALAKSITEMHYGQIQVKSTEAKIGTPGFSCFTVSLRTGFSHYPPGSMQLAKGTEESAALLLEEEPQSSAETRLPLLLLAEDNEELIQFLTQSLSARYRVIACSNGTEAWEAAVKHLPDLVITDIMMPGMDGIALCKAIKGDSRTNHIPVVLLTAKVQASHQMQGLSAGADAYITKPFSVQMLELQLSNLTAARAAMQQRLAMQATLPQAPGGDRQNVQEAFLHEVKQIIEAHLDDPEFGVPALSTLLAMSQTVLYKKMKALTGVSVQDFIRNTRLNKAAQLLRETDMHVNEVAFAVGYSDRKYFSKEFKKQFGKSPSDYTVVD